MKGAATAAALLLAVGLAPAAAHAYVRESSNWNPSSLPIPYRINTSSAPSSLGASTARTAVEGGFSTWAGPSCTAWRATDAGTTTGSANSSDGQNTILWLSGSWPAELGDASTTIGITTPVWTVGGYFDDADIRFNDVGFTWSTTGTGGTVDAQSIATHEEGHFLGLDHTPISSAIMYASYSSGLKRTLSSDDQNGVCAIYPGSGSPPPPPDGGTSSSDPCSAYGSTCDGCTPNAGCGFCGATSTCESGTSSGPTSGSCAGGYVWYPMDCSAAAPGTGRFGDPCGTSTDCGTTICADDGRGGGFCSRSCVDDCGCPSGFTCAATTVSGLSVCFAGTRMCAAPPPVDAGPPPPVDAGSLPPPVDAGSLPPTDASSGLPDAGSGSHNNDGGGIGTDAGHFTPGARSSGCGCSVPGEGGAPAAPLGLLLFGGLLGLAIRRRRR